MRDILRRMDIILMLCLLVAAALGMATLYAALHQGDLGLWHRQGMYWLLGMVLLLFLCFVPMRYIALSSWPIFLLALLCLLLVPYFGQVQMGAKRWLNLGLFHVQPSEMMKWALMLILACWFSSREANSLRHLTIAVVLILIPSTIILVQPDLGTAFVLLSAAVAMLIAAGLPWRWLIYSLLAGLISLPLLWNNMRLYQKQRVLGFLDPQSDPLGSGYHVIQSTITIGSGGLFGKGYLQGTQSRLHFLPEQHTDFIFSVLAEEGGLMFSAILLLLYGIMLARIMITATRATTRFGALLCIGIASIFMLSICVNIGMVSGLLPVVGMPLPFISYGGSALITMLAGLGLVMRVAIESHGKIPWQRPGNPLA